MAGSGQPGRLQGQPGEGFKGLRGRRTTLAAQWRPFESDAPADPFAPPGSARLPGLTLALQHERASSLPPATNISPDASSVLADRNAQATLLAARYEIGGLRLQAQAMNSQAGRSLIQTASPNTAPDTRARGYWLDTEWDQGRLSHGVSLYRLEPGLRWAGQAMPDDLQGAAFKTGWRTRQWSADASIDWLSSISGNRSAGTYASASARWRLNRRESAGLGGAFRRFGGTAWSSYGDWRFENPWGNSGLRLELNGGADNANTGQRLDFDQEWALSQGFDLSTSLGVGRERNRSDGSAGDAPTENLWRAAIALGAPLGQRANVRGTLRTEQGNRARRDHSLNLSTVWRISNAWTFETQYTRSLGRRATDNASLDPLAPIAEDTTTNGDHTIYAVLRFESLAGSRRVPLGGSGSGGGGRIEGTVFFDANRSGVQEASEQGVPNALIYLDNRFAVRTDAQGHFEFPLVAPGPRTITLRNDTLPLPWNAANEGQARTDVRLRETTRLMLPVQRAE
ncbi:MAG: carboxypeptidase-like regulatory domain-containing protein [Burkholderiaceae bacterium]